MKETPLVERVQKAYDVIDERRKILKGLIEEYNKRGETVMAHDLCLLKDKFLGYYFEICDIDLLSKEVYIMACEELKIAENEIFMTIRNAGKSIDEAKRKAVLDTIKLRYTERKAELNRDRARNLRDNCQKMIDALIQLISVTKNEEFNSKQQ